MMSDLKLKILTKAVKIRLDKGEELTEILKSYSALTDADKKKIKKEIAE